MKGTDIAGTFPDDEKHEIEHLHPLNDVIEGMVDVLMMPN